MLSLPIVIIYPYDWMLPQSNPPVTFTVTAKVQEYEADGCKALMVKGSEELTYGFRFTRDIFGPHQTMISEMYQKWGRVLAVMDGPVSRVCHDPCPICLT